MFYTQILVANVFKIIQLKFMDFVEDIVSIKRTLKS